MTAKIKWWETALLLALSAALCVGTWAQGRQQSLAEGLVRLHVLAHSDSQQEQRLKLEVRDAVLAYLQPLLQEAESRRDAERVIGAHMEEIACAAAEAARGRQVAVSLSRERYPSRSYGDFSLPAGVYHSLQVSLGDGAGQNWWCVVFPPLCLQSVSDTSVPTLSTGDLALITGKEPEYRLAFRSIELWEALKSRLERDSGSTQPKEEGNAH